ncbi:hypothetical protein [Hymenobacter sp. CRA2]|uniref:hypothetical protein n=1 Tax=Hymenobacter sp. CRA2 TaxID=1955620 RepID=UPI00098EAF70|nr:hypothetical protein [Hymenobacter sp. CRA2]OON71101.1 hypothetical protein B0919_03680 [Hymenobacter sp. CRA2]
MPAPVAFYFENTAGRILEDASGFVRVYWSRNERQLSDTRALFTHMSQAMQRRGWNRMLINQLDMRPFSQEEQQWVAHEWLPRAVQVAGYRFGAVVVSRDVLVRLATAYITTNVQGLALQYRSFENEADAAAWLLAQQPLQV